MCKHHEKSVFPSLGMLSTCLITTHKLNIDHSTILYYWIVLEIDLKLSILLQNKRNEQLIKNVDIICQFALTCWPLTALTCSALAFIYSVSWMYLHVWCTCLCSSVSLLPSFSEGRTQSMCIWVWSCSRFPLANGECFLAALVCWVSGLGFLEST